MISKKLKKNSSSKKKNIEEKLKNSGEVTEFSDKEKILTEKEIKNMFYDRTQIYKNDKLMEFLEDQF